MLKIIFICVILSPLSVLAETDCESAAQYVTDNEKLIETISKDEHQIKEQTRDLDRFVLGALTLAIDLQLLKNVSKTELHYLLFM